MRFRSWLENETGLNAVFPEILSPINRGSDTPASAEVKRTGLQPQVNSNEIHTAQKEEQDKIQAIDGAIERADSEFPGDLEGNEKLSEFKKMWKAMKQHWAKLKMQTNNTDDMQEVPTNGLASSMGDEQLLQNMQGNPNIVPNAPNQLTGPSFQ
jgi:hypothetical protein